MSRHESTAATAATAATTTDAPAPATDDPRSRTVVIGGGIAGLATASLLAREGHAVTLLEARSSVGGRVGEWTADGWRFDTGPSWYLMPEVFDHFFRLLGTSAAEQLDLVTLDPGYRVYFEGHDEPTDIAADVAANRATFERLEPGSGAAFDRYLASAGETYDLAVKHFLYTTFQSLRSLAVGEVLRRLGTLGRLLTVSLHRFVSRRFQSDRLRRILGYHAVFLGSSPYEAPSMYHLMSHLDLTGGVMYPQGGFRVLIERMVALAEAEGVTILTSSPALEILTEERTGGRGGSRGGRAAGGRDGRNGLRLRRRPRARVRGVRYRDAAGAERELAAERVVSAADLHHSETTLLPRALQTYPESWWRTRTPGPGALLILLGVRGHLPELAHHTLLFTEDWQGGFDKIFGRPSTIPSPASLYVCRPSATDATVAPEGDENLFVLVPIPADPSIGSGGVAGSGDHLVEQAADRAIAQIAEWTGIADLAERIVVRRTLGPGDFAADLGTWRGTALGPAHTLRQSAMFRGSNVSQRVDELYYAGGSTIPGIGLPMCLISAELVLKRVRGDLTGQALATPLPHGGGAGSTVITARTGG